MVDFVIHCNETAMGLHVFPIPIPPPTQSADFQMIGSLNEIFKKERKEGRKEGRKEV